MAAQVSYEQRLEVRTALREAGANEEIVGAFKDGDLNVLFSNGWDTGAFLLAAQREDLLAAGVSRGAVGAIMSLKQGETSFLTCFCSWESCHAWRIILTSHKKSWTFLKTLDQTSPMHTHLDHSSLCLISSLLNLSSSLSRCFCLYAVSLSTRQSSKGMTG